jgi:hypothetical protein
LNARVRLPVEEHEVAFPVSVTTPGRDVCPIGVQPDVRVTVFAGGDLERSDVADTATDDSDAIVLEENVGVWHKPWSTSDDHHK